MPGVAALGMVVQFGTATGTTTSATLTNVTNISVGGGDVEEIDVTSHDSAGRYREFVASFIDAGEVTFDINFNPRETTHRATSGGIMWLRDQGTIVPWKIKFPGTPTDFVTFSGFVKNVPFDGQYDDKLTSSVTVRTTGSQTWTYGT